MMHTSIYDFGALNSFAMKLSIQHWDKRIQIREVQDKIIEIVDAYLKSSNSNEKEECIRNIHRLNDIYAYIWRGKSFTVEKYRLSLSDEALDNLVHNIQQLQ